MPLVGFRGALWVGDRGSVPRDRSVDWRRSARFRRNQGPPAQTVAVHQGGDRRARSPRTALPFSFPDHAKFGAVRRRRGLRPRRSGPRRFDAGRRAVRKLRGHAPVPSFRRQKGLTAPAYWKFESSPLQQKSQRTFGSVAISARSWSAVAANLDRFARAEKLKKHEWEAAGHNDVDEFGVAEFLAQEGAAPSELIKILFGRFSAGA